MAPRPLFTRTSELLSLTPTLNRVRTWLVRLLRSTRLPAIERAIAGNSLAKLGDPRFAVEQGSLPADPMLGFVEIPAGSFEMGSDPRHDEEAAEHESPQHEVSLPRFYMARWPVTVAQFRAFVQETQYPMADEDCLKGRANHPVLGVTWHNALAYCRWLDERLRALAPERLTASVPEPERAFWQGLAEASLGVGLPSEAEWEKAARGPDRRIYPWGDTPDPDRANYSSTGIGGTTAVGCFPKGISSKGCEEMSGNVWEWTRSLWGDYPYPKQGTAREAREDLAAEGGRMLRGGAFYSSSGSVRCACRSHSSPEARVLIIGFRVVVSPFFSRLY